MVIVITSPDQDGKKITFNFICFYLRHFPTLESYGEASKSTNEKNETQCTFRLIRDLISDNSPIVSNCGYLDGNRDNINDMFYQ